MGAFSDFAEQLSWEIKDVVSTIRGKGGISMSEKYRKSDVQPHVATSFIPATVSASSAAGTPPWVIVPAPANTKERLEEVEALINVYETAIAQCRNKGTAVTDNPQYVAYLRECEKARTERNQITVFLNAERAEHAAYRERDAAMQGIAQQQHDWNQVQQTEEIALKREAEVWKREFAHRKAEMEQEVRDFEAAIHEQSIINSQQLEIKRLQQEVERLKFLLS